MSIRTNLSEAESKPLQNQKRKGKWNRKTLKTLNPDVIFKFQSYCQGSNKKNNMLSSIFSKKCPDVKKIQPNLKKNRIDKVEYVPNNYHKVATGNMNDNCQRATNTRKYHNRFSGLKVEEVMEENKINVSY